MYMNVRQGLLENKEFKFNVSIASNLVHLICPQSGLKNTYLVHFLPQINGENRFNATIKLQIWVPVIVRGQNIATVKNASGTQVLLVCVFLFCFFFPITQYLFTGPYRGKKVVLLQIRIFLKTTLQKLQEILQHYSKYMLGQPEQKFILKTKSKGRFSLPFYP